MQKLLVLFLSLSTFVAQSQKRNPANKAIFLEDIPWTKAKDVLTPETVVVIPLGAEAKEHGPHLPLNADFLQATDAANRVALQRNVVIAPVMNSGFYPAFIKYAGSVSLSFQTSVETVLQTVRCLASYGPKRFYVINVGISTTPTLEAAAKILAGSGLLLCYSDYNRPRYDFFETLATQAYGGHADEIETSSVLSIRPDLVAMRNAVNDSSMKGKTGMMTPVALAGGTLNKSGLNGYATLATKEKGIAAMKGYAAALVVEIDSATTCALPTAKDNSALYKSYEGDYGDSTGTKLQISQKDNTLYFISEGRDLRNFFPLYRDAPDYFTSLPMNILFVKNDSGVVLKAWCQSRGKSFWLIKK